MILAHRLAAEFVGTAVLVFGGCGSAVLAAGFPGGLGIGFLGVALAFGITVLAMIYAVGHVSGGHFNPAVTMGFFVTRRISVPLAVFYWIIQFGAAALAALLLRWILPSQVKAAHYGAPSVNAVIDPGKAVTIEAVCTFFLVIVVFATAVDAKGAFDKIAGLAIGLTIVFGILMAGPLTGGAFNPARAFGPELISGYWTDAWVWYVGPLAGGALAAILYEMLYLTERSSGDVAPAVAEPSDEAEPEPAGN